MNPLITWNWVSNHPETAFKKAQKKPGKMTYYLLYDATNYNPAIPINKELVLKVTECLRASTKKLEEQSNLKHVIDPTLWVGYKNALIATNQFNEEEIKEIFEEFEEIPEDELPTQEDKNVNNTNDSSEETEDSSLIGAIERGDKQSAIFLLIAGEPISDLPQLYRNKLLMWVCKQAPKLKERDDLIRKLIENDVDLNGKKIRTPLQRYLELNGDITTLLFGIKQDIRASKINKIFSINGPDYSTFNDYLLLLMTFPNLLEDWLKYEYSFKYLKDHQLHSLVKFFLHFQGTKPLDIAMETALKRFEPGQKDRFKVLLDMEIAKKRSPRCIEETTNHLIKLITSDEIGLRESPNCLLEIIKDDWQPFFKRTRALRLLTSTFPISRKIFDKIPQAFEKLDHRGVYFQSELREIKELFVGETRKKLEKIYISLKVQLAASQRHYEQIMERAKELGASGKTEESQ